MRFLRSLSVLLILPVFLSGCFQLDTMSDIDIHTTAFPIEYITRRLYGDHSNIRSIFPNGAIRGEAVSERLLNDFSSTDLFIFNGLDPNENNYVRYMSNFKMRNERRQLKIIDVSASLIYRHKIEDLWLDPMSLLTIANNIKMGFEEYINSAYLLNHVREQYNILRQELIQLDADFNDAATRANRRTLVVSDDMFLFLRRYGLNVISLEENVNLTQRNIHTVNEMIDAGDVVVIFTIQGQPVNETIRTIQERTEIRLVPLHDLFKLTEDEANRNETYFSIMRNNLELLKLQLYN